MMNKLNTPPLEIIYKEKSRSLSIRPLSEEMAEEMFAIVQTNARHLSTFMDWAHLENSVPTQKKRLKNSREDYFQGKNYDLAVFDQETGELLMAAGWHKGHNRNARSLSIGYWTAQKHCNKGLATLVTQILIAVGFDHMGSDRIEIECNKQNIVSQKVIKKCGFHFEGEVRNYFNEPTLDMLKNGHTTERSCLLFSLLPKERDNLSWYQEIRKNIEIRP